MNNDKKKPEHAANHDHAPWDLMRALVFLANSAHFRLRENAQSDQAGGDAEADDPVEQFEALSVSRGRCGVFAQKKGSFASSQIAR